MSLAVSEVDGPAYGDYVFADSAQAVARAGIVGWDDAGVGDADIAAVVVPLSTT